MQNQKSSMKPSKKVSRKGPAAVKGKPRGHSRKADRSGIKPNCALRAYDKGRLHFQQFGVRNIEVVRELCNKWRYAWPASWPRPVPDERTPNEIPCLYFIIFLCSLELQPQGIGRLFAS